MPVSADLDMETAVEVEVAVVGFFLRVVLFIFENLN